MPEDRKPIFFKRPPSWGIEFKKKTLSPREREIMRQVVERKFSPAFLAVSARIREIILKKRAKQMVLRR